MASHDAIAAVTRTLRTLLLDRMVTGATVTVAPPDITVADVDGARVNLYLFQVLEHASLKNQEIPGHGHPAAYGRPPLPLNLRYLMTTHSAIETQAEAEINAQVILGDAMRVFHAYGNHIDGLEITNVIAGTPGDPILDDVLADEFERIKIVLHPTSIDDLTKVWSALSEENFRRSVVYEATVVQIENPEPRSRPLPVATRQILSLVRRRPVIRAAYVTPPPPNGPIGEHRARIGDQLTIEAEHILADRLYVRLGALEPIRVSPPGDGVIRIVVPDDQYPIDLDHPATRPIPAADRLQPGPLEVRIIAEHAVEGVAGGLGRGSHVAEPRRYASNIALMQLVPRVASVVPLSATAADILRVNGTRLWHPGARVAEVIIADAAIAIRHAGGDPWAPPSSTAVEIPLAELEDVLPTLTPADDPYPVAVQVDGARSRDAGIDFRLVP